MIAKTTLGNDFEGALTYGAGLRKGRGKEPGEAPLLVVSNVIPGTAQQMAQEMQFVAGQSRRIQKPVWHTVLSWKAGEAVSGAQKVAAAKRYCELMGAPLERHQVVVYEHKDKPHAHIHIYINRVPIDGGAALRSDNNFYRQPKVTRQIAQELGMELLPERRRSVKDLDPKKELVRAAVRRALEQQLARDDRGGEQWLAARLEQARIQVRFTHDRGGVLRGVSFELDGVAVKGQEVGFKAAQLRQALQQEMVAPELTQNTQENPKPQQAKATPRKKRALRP